MKPTIENMNDTYYSYADSVRVCSPYYRRPTVPTPEKTMFHPIILAVVFTGFLSSLTAGLLAQGKAEISGGILNVPNTYLFFVCIAGGLLGGLVSVFILPVAETRRQLIFKFLSSSITSVMFTPWLIHHMQWSEAPDSILAVSGLMALTAWGVLLKLVPWATGRIIGIFTSDKTETK